MLFQDKIEKIKNLSKKDGNNYEKGNFEIYENKVEKKDIIALILSGYLVFAPIFIVLIIILVLVY